MTNWFVNILVLSYVADSPYVSALRLDGAPQSR